MKTRVYPADAKGYCLRGFCPTICKSEQAAQELSDYLDAEAEKAMA